jgi:hypothetical protein
MPNWTAQELTALIRRDICLLYHVLSDYGFVMGDLDYRGQFSLPYWSALEFDDLVDGDARFIRCGCLVMLFAMAMEEIDGAGSYLTNSPARFSAALRSLDTCVFEDEEELQLLAHVRSAFACVASPTREHIQKAEADGAWVYDTIVGTYFATRAVE